jgi:trimeric autotransporter adhesin
MANIGSRTTTSSIRKSRQVVLSLLCAVALFGCGGGNQVGVSAALAAAATLRVLSADLLAGSVTPEQAADQLMNFAEANFPVFFPAHKATLTSDPFVYRYYPETGTYLGVVIGSGSQYQLGGVYVLGGSFGAVPSYVGPLTSFITATGETLVPMTVAVMDGAIQGATVCLDKNQNGSCDTDEPRAKTGASGNATLQVLQADAGNYPVVAEVGTDAVDADFGAVQTAFTMSAPADRPALIDPFTTLVRHISTLSYISTGQATENLQGRAGLNAGVMDDYTRSSASDATVAATVARLLVVQIQASLTSLTPSVGTPDAAGTVMTAANIRGAVLTDLLQRLPSFTAAAAKPAVKSACSSGVSAAACKAAIATQASQLLSQAPLTSGNVGVAVLAQRTIDVSPTPSNVTAQTRTSVLASFGYTDPQNWSYRTFGSTAAEKVPDSNGLTRYTETRRISTNGAVTTLSDSFDPTRNDVTWSGTEWGDCPVGFENKDTPRDAKGHNISNSCGGRNVSSGVRGALDISGKTMASVAAMIRTYPYNDFPTWGSAALASTLGARAFPDGSTLLVQSTTDIAAGVTYLQHSAGIVTVASAALAAGGDNRTTVANEACNATVSFSPPASLEAMIAANHGTPCIFGPGTINGSSSGDRNEYWGQSTLSIGTIGTVSTGTPMQYYDASAEFIRVAFNGGNATTYYRCQRRWSDGSVRNCDTIGTGTFTISQLGNGRALTFNNVPADAATLTYTRVFVERGGVVYFGYQSKPLSLGYGLRLNGTAMNALFAPLGIPEINP